MHLVCTLLKKVRVSEREREREREPPNPLKRAGRVGGDNLSLDKQSWGLLHRAHPNSSVAIDLNLASLIFKIQTQLPMADSKNLGFEIWTRINQNEG